MDMDGDRYGQGMCQLGSVDCDEQNPNINPARDRNGVDDNCDGRIDECQTALQTCAMANAVARPARPVAKTVIVRENRFTATPS